jgi:hypothetical protein
MQSQVECLLRLQTCHMKHCADDGEGSVPAVPDRMPGSSCLFGLKTPLLQTISDDSEMTMDAGCGEERGRLDDKQKRKNTQS